MVSQPFTLPDPSIPEFHWEHGDDLCDCTFQRIGYWTNPYLGETEKVRWCCILKELEESFPQYFQHIRAYWDENSKEWVSGQAEWNGEHEMPRALWHRQLAIRSGESLDTIRDRLLLDKPPAGVPRPQPEVQDDVMPQQPADIFQAYGALYMEHQNVLAALQASVDVMRGLKEGDISLADIEVSDHSFTVHRQKDN